MMRHLYIVRHAQALTGQHYNTDIERELSPEGILQARQLGNHLNESNNNIDLIIASDALRARSTAQLIAETINYPLEKIKVEPKIYSAATNDFISIVKALPDSVPQVLIVGHNPTILELINFLSDTDKQSMTTCELAKLSIPNNWSLVSEGCGQLLSCYHSS